MELGGFDKKFIKKFFKAVYAYSTLASPVRAIQTWKIPKSKLLLFLIDSPNIS